MNNVRLAITLLISAFIDLVLWLVRQCTTKTFSLLEVWAIGFVWHVGYSWNNWQTYAICLGAAILSSMLDNE